ncbi:MAG TPA: PAS domain S-box protein, partial [Candidatus Kapabacteria bacterium]|nr:PAS domain S-box protein [Candidatus Kapabacteria bacterium]
MEYESPELIWKASQDALKAFNQQITSILERISDGFVALDTSWRFTYLNRKGAEIFHRLRQKKDSLLGKVLWDEFPEILGTDTERNYRRAVQDQVTAEFETQLDDAWFIVRAYPSSDGLSIYLLDITRRKEVEEERNKTETALRASEQHFRAAFDQVATGMAVADLSGRLEEANDRFVEILGYSKEELLTRTYADITHPDDIAVTQENVRRLLEGKVKDFTYEKRFVRKDGSIVWAIASVTFLLDHEGKPSRFIGVIDDITPRKRAEEKLREGAERLQLALAAGRMGHWSWNTATDLLDFGPGTAELFGLPAGSSITWEALRQMLHQDDREPTQRALLQALETHSDYDMEYRVRDGRGYRWIASRGRGVYTTEGKVSGMIGVAHDITDRRMNDHVHSRLAAVVESSDDAIISMGLDAVITTWNKGAEEMFGYAADEVIGKSIHLLLPAGRQDEETLILDRIIKGERVEHYETMRARKDGQLLNVSLTVSPVFDHNNQ